MREEVERRAVAVWVNSLYGKTASTTAAVIVSFCGAARPAPPTSPKEQNKAQSND